MEQRDGALKILKPSGTTFNGGLLSGMKHAKFPQIVHRSQMNWSKKWNFRRLAAMLGFVSVVDWTLLGTLSLDSHEMDSASENATQIVARLDLVPSRVVIHYSYLGWKRGTSWKFGTIASGGFHILLHGTTHPNWRSSSWKVSMFFHWSSEGDFCRNKARMERT